MTERLALPRFVVRLAGAVRALGLLLTFADAECKASRVRHRTSRICLSRPSAPNKQVGQADDEPPCRLFLPERIDPTLVLFLGDHPG